MNNEYYFWWLQPSWDELYIMSYLNENDKRSEVEAIYQSGWSWFPSFTMMQGWGHRNLARGIPIPRRPCFGLWKVVMVHHASPEITHPTQGPRFQSCGSPGPWSSHLQCHTGRPRSPPWVKATPSHADPSHADERLVVSKWPEKWEKKHLKDPKKRKPQVEIQGQQVWCRKISTCLCASVQNTSIEKRHPALHWLVQTLLMNAA